MSVRSKGRSGGKMFSTAPITAASAGEPIPGAVPPAQFTPALVPTVPAQSEVETPSSQDASTASPHEVETPVRKDAETPRRTDAKASRRRDVQTSARTESPSDGQPARTAFTWRLTADGADALDTLVLTLRRGLGRGRLTRDAVLTALVAVANDDDALRKALLEELRRSQTS